MTFDWLHLSVIVGLIAVYGAYLLLVGPLRRRFHTADQIWAEPVEPREVLFFSGGILALLVADASPIHELSEQYLFSAHMVQHMLMTMVAPPLLLLGTPAWMLRPALRSSAVIRVARQVTRPLPAIVIFNGTLAVWHLPWFYNAALTNHYVHILEHLTFLGSAILLWWPIFSPLKELPRLNYPAQILYLFVQSLLPAIIAAFITFSTRLIYTYYADKPRLWDISPITDQQIAGLIMKLAGTLIFWLAATIIFFIWFRYEEAEVEKSWE